MVGFVEFFALMIGLSSAVGLIAIFEQIKDRRLLPSEIAAAIYHTIMIVLAAQIILSVMPSSTLQFLHLGGVALPVAMDVVDPAFMTTSILAVFITFIVITYVVFRLRSPVEEAVITTSIFIVILVTSLVLGIPIWGLILISIAAALVGMAIGTAVAIMVVRAVQEIEE